MLNKAGKCFVPAERYIWASLILLHYSKRMSKIIWKQRFIATAPTENTSRRQQSSEPERPFSYRVGVRLLRSWEAWWSPAKLQTATASAAGSPSQSVSHFKPVPCYDGGSGHLCARAVAMLCESEVTASTFPHLSESSCTETIEGGRGPFAHTLFNLIVKYKRQSPHIESCLNLPFHSHLSPLN